MRILQVCNVGNICGGTAACAWSITHALTGQDHVILFLSSPTKETLNAFRHCEVRVEKVIDDSIVEAIAPDVIILHNTSPDRVKISSEVFTLQFQHSAGKRASATKHVACSKWLADQLPGSPDVLYQPVPIPPQPQRSSSRNLDDELIIGRICTPTIRKWPPQLIDLYSELAEQNRSVTWEFVGTPPEMKDAFQAACRGRAVFHDASVDARHHLWRWHAMLYHHPALTESFGRTVAEAMRSGCIPIVDARGGFLEQITHEETGFLCTSVQDFAVGVESLRGHGERAQLSRNAVASANERFSLTAFYSQLRTLLFECRTNHVSKV